MGFFSSFAEVVEAAVPWSTVEAEAPKEESDEKVAAPEDTNSDDANESEEKEEETEEEEEEEEEEDEEEIVDPKETLERECMEGPDCAPAKHHYDECAERVTAAQESGEGTKEDCVEEFFHLMHCATNCAAPKLWAQLK